MAWETTRPAAETALLRLDPPYLYTLISVLKTCTALWYTTCDARARTTAWLTEPLTVGRNDIAAASDTTWRCWIKTLKFSHDRTLCSRLCINFLMPSPDIDLPKTHSQCPKNVVISGGIQAGRPVSVLSGGIEIREYCILASTMLKPRYLLSSRYPRLVNVKEVRRKSDVCMRLKTYVQPHRLPSPLYLTLPNG